MFICTVVVGSISIASPNRISKVYFIRDTSFLMITLGILTLYGIYQKVFLINTIFLFLFYVTYIVTVLLTPWIEEMYLNYEVKLPSTSTGSNLQTAFWFSNSANNDNDDNGSDNPSFRSTVASDELQRESTSNFKEIISENMNGNGYKFLILDENIEINEESNVNNFTSNNDNNIESQRDIDDYDLDPHERDLGMINLSGGSQSNPRKIIENHFHRVNSNDHHDAIDGKASEASVDDADRHINGKYEGDRDGTQNKNHKSVKTNFSSNFEIYDDMINDDPDSLLKPLLSEDDEEGEGVFGMIDNSTKIGNVYILRCCNLIKKQMVKLFMNKKIKENEEDWSRYSFSQKVVTVIEYPFVILKDLTIPTMDEDLWYKPYACLQPITIPLFVMYMSGNIEIFFSHPFLILSISAITSLYILLYTSHNQQSKNVIFVYSWMSLGFMMCIVWICMFANELIICLVLLGQVLNIPSYYLGLTVLAWGNSISDLFSNVAIAKRGLHDMAVVS